MFSFIAMIFMSIAFCIASIFSMRWSAKLMLKPAFVAMVSSFVFLGVAIYIALTIRY